MLYQDRAIVKTVAIDTRNNAAGQIPLDKNNTPRAVDK
jgi:hypothetical protein